MPENQVFGQTVGGGAADNSSKDVVQSVFGDPDYSIDSQFLSGGYPEMSGCGYEYTFKQTDRD
jgi:hypothetical protein